MTDEFEQSQFAGLLPDGDAQRRTEGGREENQEHASIEVTESAVLCRGRQRGDVHPTFPRLEHKLSGEGLARCLDWYPTRFQPLPIGTAREVFPQAARPVSFMTRVMGQCGTSSDFHWYAAAP